MVHFHVESGKLCNELPNKGGLLLPAWLDPGCELLYLLRDLVSGVTMDMEFLISMQNSNKYQKIFQYTLDMCNMLAQKRNNIFKKWFATFFDAGNFKTYCPVEPNVYYLRNYNYNTLYIPKFLYAGKYRVKFDMNQLRSNNKIRDFVVGCAFVVEIK